MKQSRSPLAQAVSEFCAQIGTDPLLVQGPGGNVSWKEDDVLWIKASGKWLADAKSGEIFVPVDLPHLQEALAKSDFTASPNSLNSSQLRPSIETLLHVLMPHKVVVHLHPIEMLAHLVRNNQKEEITRLVGQKVNWIYVDYFRPGAELAEAVSLQLENPAEIDAIFLGNHGVLIGGEDIEMVSITMDVLTSALKQDILLHPESNRSLISSSEPSLDGYKVCADAQVNQLVFDETLIQILRTAWALYPDHVVFLGAEPVILDNASQLSDWEQSTDTKPAFVFVLGDGVYESCDATLAQKSQLRCYYDVAIRLSIHDELTTLTNQQVWEIVSWESEKHRLSQNVL